MSEISSSIHTVGLTSTSNFVVHEVEKTQAGGAYDAVVDILETWDFFPYPACTRRQLAQVGLFILACSPPTGAFAATAAGQFDVTPTTIFGVVGVVWVPLAPGSRVEGYIHVVAVRPEHRRRRIALSLLLKALRLVEGGSPRRVIARWRLHTMVLSPRTSEYLRAALRCPHPVLGHPSTHDESDALGDERLGKAERLVEAMPGVYQRLGFLVRKNMYAYYDKCADAVEMVKPVPGAMNRSSG